MLIVRRGFGQSFSIVFVRDSDSDSKKSGNWKMVSSESGIADKHYKCKWCNGTGFVSSGAKCISCSGKGCYENPVSSGTTTVAAIVAGFFSLGLWWIGGEQWWNYISNGFSVFCLGVAVISFTMWLRGPEEEGWNGLMLIGSLLAVFGLLSIPFIAAWRALN